MWNALRYRKLRKLQAQFADPETRNVKLNVKFHRGKDYLWAEVAGVPGLVTQGSTVRELMDNLSAAISLYFDVDIVIRKERHKDRRRRAGGTVSFRSVTR